MGVLLVNRGSRFQGFTPEGERVLDWARRIVGDTRAMREEINALRHGLSGRLRIAAIPTALAMVAALTTPYRERHPNVQFTICSRTSIEILDLLENLEIDAGITYRRQRAARPRQHRAALSRALPAAHLGRRAARQSRQRHLGGGRAGAALPAHARHAEPPHHRPAAARAPAAKSRPTLESDSMILLFSHVRTGRWASVMPAKLAETLGLTETHPRHPDHRAGSGADHRPGGAVARTDDAAHRRAGGRSAPRRCVAGRLSSALRSDRLAISRRRASKAGCTLRFCARKH